MKVRVDIKGLRELQASLHRLAGDLAGEVLEAAARAAAEPVLREAQARAPRRTGQLRAHIVASEPERAQDGVSIRVGPDKDSFYGLFQELGTRHHAAQPFLRPALQAQMQAAANAAAAELRKALRRAAKG